MHMYLTSSCTFCIPCHRNEISNCHILMKFFDFSIHNARLYRKSCTQLGPTADKVAEDGKSRKSREAHYYWLKCWTPTKREAGADKREICWDRKDTMLSSSRGIEADRTKHSSTLLYTPPCFPASEFTLTTMPLSGDCWQYTAASSPDTSESFIF